MQTAVLLLIFNRPDTTARVFESIRQAQPPRLYVAADGPRKTIPEESKLVARTRDIATSVDWPCELVTLFRLNNLGCKQAVSTAITWFFENEDNGIILEDDCLPSQSFFYFCELNLQRYKDCSDIFSINGSNYLDSPNLMPNSNDYFFADPDVWGWATWRDRWAFYNSSKTKAISNILSIHYLYLLLRHPAYSLDVGLNTLLAATGRLSSWAYPWTLSILSQGGLSITPSISLVTNIGFGPDATHTSNSSFRYHVPELSCDTSFDLLGNNYPLVFAHWYLHAIHKRRLTTNILVCVKFIFALSNLIFNHFLFGR